MLKAFHIPPFSSFQSRLSAVCILASTVIATIMIAPSAIATTTQAEPESASKREASVAVIGQPSPPLTVVDASGQKRSLLQLRGKKALLLTFFPRCFTGNCTSQLTSLREVYPSLQKAGVEVWGVSTDSAQGRWGQRAFAKHLQLPFPLIPDTDRKISLACGAVQTRQQMAARMSVFIDKNGVVRWIDKQMDIRSHGKEVVARVQAEAAMAPTPAR